MPEIDFRKSRVSNIPTQRGVADSMLMLGSISGTPVLQKSPHRPALIPVPPWRGASRRSGSARLWGCGVVQAVICDRGSISQKNGFSNIRCTLWTPPPTSSLPALHHEKQRSSVKEPAASGRSRRSARRPGQQRRRTGGLLGEPRWGG